MSNVNWTKYNCDICRAVGLVLAGVVAAAVTWVISQIGLPIWLMAVLFLVVWAVLFYVVDGYCEGRGRMQVMAPAGASASTTEPDDASEAHARTADDARAEDDAVAAHAEAEAREAAARAEAERQAAEQAERERAAAEAAAEDARRAAEAEREAAAQEARLREAAERRAEEAERARQDAAEAEARAQTAPATETAEPARENEMAEAPAVFSGAPEPVDEASRGPDRDGDGVREGAEEGTRPQGLDGPRGGQADDLKRIKGVGPKLEQLCHSLGFFHFDQIANWTADEVAWVDSNLGGFNGRVTRDDWIAQARVLASGGETEFSKRVDDGDVPSSQ